MKQEVILASTHIDQHGQRLTLEFLKQMNALINGPEKPLVTFDHDNSIPPAGKTLESRVVRGDDGEYQLVAVQEMFDSIDWVDLEDGTRVFKQECKSDRHPFVGKYQGASTEFMVSVDPMNFETKETFRSFVGEIEQKSGLSIQVGKFARKSLLPDPELIVQLSQALTTYLLVRAGVIIVDKIAESLAEVAASDAVKFYSLAKATIVDSVKYFRPKGRPITYLFVAPGKLTIEFIARSENPELVISGVSIERFEKALLNAKYLRELLGAVRIQYLLNDSSEWEFNYLVSSTGAVIGTELSLTRRMERFQLMIEQNEKQIDAQRPSDDISINNSSTGQMNRAVVLTALGLEHEAICSHLSDLEEIVHPEGTIYHKGIFVGQEGIWEVFVVEIGPGNNRAAAEAERAINFISPQIALFVGVGGGVKDVKLGDVVVATKVYGYESGSDKSTFQPRPSVGATSYPLEQRARAESKSEDWLKRLGGTVLEPKSTVLVGPIAAGEKVVKSKRSETYKFLKDKYGDALVVEMEGRGFLDAVEMNQSVQAAVIRGVSDLIAGKRRSDAEGWQQTAARNASAFAFEILSKITPRTGKRVASRIDSSEQRRDESLLIMVPPDGRIALLSALRLEMGKNLKLIVTPKTTKDSEFLARLTGDTELQTFRIAYDNVALVARVESVVRIHEGAEETWMVELIPQDNSGEQAGVDLKPLGHSDDQIAEMRARRILLDEKLQRINGTPAELMNWAAVENSIKGRNSQVKIERSPFPPLYGELGNDIDLFKAVARLLAILQLKLSGTVEFVYQLDLEFTDQSELQVRFEGIRPRTSKKEPFAITVNGICKL